MVSAVKIEDLVDAIRGNRIRITDHADEEAQSDVLSYKEIFMSVVQGEVIEDYPDDKPYPTVAWYMVIPLPTRRCTAFGPLMRKIGGQSSSRYIVLIHDHGLTGESGDQKMMPFSNCPVCGGEMAEKSVEKLLRGGNHTAVLTVRAEVCLSCGERLYAQETVTQFERIRSKLENHDIGGFEPLGQSFRVVHVA